MTSEDLLSVMPADPLPSRLNFRTRHCLLEEVTKGEHSLKIIRGFVSLLSKDDVGAIGMTFLPDGLIRPGKRSGNIFPHRKSPRE